MAKKPVTKIETKDPLIIPSIRVNGEKHILEEMFESGDMPEMKAVGFVKIGTLVSNWVSYTVTFRGNEVIKIECEEPNVKGIAEENAKIAFVGALIDQADA